MRKSVCVLFLSVILLIGLAGSASALHYSATVNTLTLVFGDPPFAATQAPSLGPVLDQLNNEFANIAKFSVGDDILNLKVVEFGSVDLEVETLSGLWQDIDESGWQFNFNDTLVLKDKGPGTVWNVTIAKGAPEPATFLLLGLGLVGLIGFRRWKHRK